MNEFASYCAYANHEEQGIWLLTEFICLEIDNCFIIFLIDKNSAPNSTSKILLIGMLLILHTCTIIVLAPLFVGRERVENFTERICFKYCIRILWTIRNFIVPCTGDVVSGDCNPNIWKFYWILQGVYDNPHPKQNLT